MAFDTMVDVVQQHVAARRPSESEVDVIVNLFTESRYKQHLWFRVALVRIANPHLQRHTICQRTDRCRPQADERAHAITRPDAV